MRKLRKSCNHKRNIIASNNCQLQDLPMGGLSAHTRKKKTSVLKEVLKTPGIKNNSEGLVEAANAAADPIHASQFGEIHFKNRLQKQYERYCTDNPNGPKLTAAKFDDHLHRWAMKVWPCALDIIYRRIASSQKT